MKDVESLPHILAGGWLIGPPSPSPRVGPITLPGRGAGVGDIGDLSRSHHEGLR